MQKEKSDLSELENIRKELHALNERLMQVEETIKILKKGGAATEQKEYQDPGEEFEIKFPSQTNSSIEFSIGEYGMAWLGNIVLFFGLIFLVNYLQNTVNQIISFLVGFSAVIIIYLSSHYFRKSLPVLSKLLVYNGHFLMYFFTLRLHFFQDIPLLPNKTVALVLLIIVTGAFLYRAFRTQSQLLAGISSLMILAAGIFSNSAGVLAGMATVTSVITMLLYYKLGWLKLAFVFILIIYLAHLSWLLNNPFMGNTPEFIQSPGAGYVYFIATGFIFSMLAIIPKKEKVAGEFIISSIIWNGLGFTFILAAIIITYFEKNYVPIFGSITLFCLIYSIILQIKSELKIAASMYVLYGFLALSVAIFGIFGFPKSYALFALQSLMVVSVALWFRSRFMVVINTILFLLLLIFYAKSETNNDLTNFAYMLVAFISARIINWKKERLNIKTEFVRDLYLISGFGMTLAAFYHVSPPSYITASWIFAGILFFLMSILIKNFKYRWLAIASLLASAIRLILVDMSSLNIGYRVMVFLALAVISITVSILYTKYLIRKKE